ncbi:MAG: HAD hydrolase-like protein [Opitutae bacterium]|nr:HAD hydrolase-like protein [Opitutae bacterium]
MEGNREILLLWDIDGTLLSAEGAGPQAFERALWLQFGERIQLSSIDWPGSTDFAIAYALLEKLGWEVNRKNARNLLDSYLEELPGLLESTRTKANPGVLELLEVFDRESGVYQALLTGNIQRGSQLKLGHIGVEHYFLFGAYADYSDHRNDLGFHALDLARKRLGKDFSGDQVYVIGDTPKDIECGKHIGAHTVAVATGHHSVKELAKHQPSVVLESLADPRGLRAYIGD